MPFSEVPRIELNQDGTVTLFVNVGGFRVGTPVEISGYATQANGAIATFQDVQLMPSGDLVEGVILVVKGVSVIGSAFTPHEPITIVARAADVWITKLDLDTGEKKPPTAIAEARARSGQVNIRTAWKSDEKSYHSVYSSAPPPEEPTQTVSLLRHGTWWDRGKTDRLDVVMGGRFTRLFPYLPAARFDHKDLESLAGAMIAPPEEPEPQGQDDPEENKGIPAAYTYLGQFTDHDLTFDPISHLRETLSRARLRALVDFRTPVSTWTTCTDGDRTTSPTCIRKTGSTCCRAGACRAIPSTRARSSYPGDRAAERSSATPATTRTASSRNCTPSSCDSTMRSSIAWARMTSASRKSAG
jgi:hypothetical protein